VLLGLFVVAYGLVTCEIWATPVTEKAPFNHPSRSWLLGATHGRSRSTWRWSRRSRSWSPGAGSCPRRRP
jgi:hypothetical protein